MKRIAIDRCCANYWQRGVPGWKRKREASELQTFCRTGLSHLSLAKKDRQRALVDTMIFGVETIDQPTRTTVTRDSPSDAKIELFRNLFRGREDVYPRRFESRKTNKSGYAPACANEWVRGVCEKPRIKCSECPNRRFLPVTNDVMRWHLSGRDYVGRDFVMGVYPMLLDETCWFLAVD